MKCFTRRSISDRAVVFAIFLLFIVLLTVTGILIWFLPELYTNSLQFTDDLFINEVPSLPIFEYTSPWDEGLQMRVYLCSIGSQVLELRAEVEGSELVFSWRCEEDES